MAKIRAYKLAEELGIDRGEIVEKAAGAGIEIKSPMSSLDEDQVALLREKLGGAKVSTGQQVVERRVERKGGAAVIRRRKKAVEPEPEPEPEPVVEEATPSVVAEAEAAEPEVAAEPAPETVGEPDAQPAVAETAEKKADAAESDGDAKPARKTVAKPAEEKPATKVQPRKRVREVVNLREQEQLARQATGRMTARRTVSVDPRAFTSPRRRRRDAPARPAAAAAKPAKPVKRTVRVEGSISVAELARQLGAKAAEVQGKLMGLGTMASINQMLDLETAGKVADTYGFEIQKVGFDEEKALASSAATQESANLEPRPPVITVMGHVDHGKTSLLDALRKAKVVEGEAGGITQHIGAYQVEVSKGKLTFIDTPGHAAFTDMRARGAQATDIVVLVVAANDGVMPQTIEAINHARAANVPIVVAINKIDLPEANAQRTRQKLMEHELIPEDLGGDTICVEISAIKGTGLDQLLEMLALQAEVLELKADPALPATGVVLEAELDKGRGPVATILVQSGTLRRGDPIVLGTCHGRVRTMQDDTGQRVNEAGPSTPVQLVGLSAVPNAGDAFHVVESERVAKEVAEHRQSQQRSQPAEAKPKLTLEEFFAESEAGGVKELPVVLKTDVHGSMEAAREALIKLSTDAVKVNVVHAGVGGITENDVMLAAASQALVFGFHVRPDPAARKAAERDGIDIRVYRVIYELTDEVKRAMAGLLPPTTKEQVIGQVEVRDTFTIPKIGLVAGCYVTDGNIRRNANCRLIRDGVQIYEGKIGSLKRFKDDVREVATGFECGLGIEGYNDVKVGDVIEAYVVEEEPATL